MGPRRSLRARGAALLAMLLGAAACEALVSDSLPSSIACVGDLPGICPAGESCVDGKCTATASCGAGGCAHAHDAGHDATLPDAHLAFLDSGKDGGGDSGHDAAPREATPPADAARDAGQDAPSLGAIGAPCVDSTSCQTGLLCAPPTDLNGLALSASVCTHACCTNDDCAGGVCYPTTGGNLCITQAMAATCGTSCGTACCEDSDCGTKDETCSLGATAAGPSVPSCTSTSACGGSCGGEGRSCDDDSKCASGVCADEGNYGCFLDDCACVATCCNDGDCKSSGGGSCAWVVETDSDGTSVILRSCAQPGQLPSGTGCSLDAGAETCAGGSCLRFPNQTGPLCTQPCCRDSDCAGIGGDGGAAWTCAPFDQEVGGGAIIALLVCEPPPSR